MASWAHQEGLQNETVIRGRFGWKTQTTPLFSLEETIHRTGSARTGSKRAKPRESIAAVVAVGLGQNLACTVYLLFEPDAEEQGGDGLGSWSRITDPYLGWFPLGIEPTRDLSLGTVTRLRSLFWTEARALALTYREARALREIEKNMRWGLAGLASLPSS